MSLNDVLFELENVRGIQAKADHFIGKFQMKARVTGNFLLLDYDQINSPRKHKVVDECRGLVVHVDPATDLTYIVRLPFKRFYNFGEYPELEAEFDWSTAVVDEKCDGSMIAVWYNHEANRWEIGTRGNAFGDNTVTALTGEETNVSFRSLFLRALGKTESEMQKLFDSKMFARNTYIFELCTLENKVVTPYEKDSVYLLGARRNVDGHDISPRALNWIAQDLNVLRPEVYSITNSSEIVAAANALPNLKEGFVVRDGENRRMKVKSATYVELHHMRGEGMSPKRAIKIVLEGEAAEVISYFPEYGEYLRAFDQIVYDRLHDIEASYYKIHKIESQKDFALEAVKTKWPSVLFAMRKGIGMMEFINSMNDSSKCELFKN